MLKILLGGSPCTHWSIAKKGRETTASGIGWELFENYLIAKERFKPDLFLYENNKSVSKEIKEQISKELGAPLQYINSALVSAQNRERFYCHNFGDVPQPEDRGILLQDILETDATTAIYQRPRGFNKGGIKYDKAPTLTSSDWQHNNFVIEPSEKPVYRVENGLIEIKGKAYPIKLPDGHYTIRKLTVTECCRLQTLPDDYCRAVSKTQAYRGLGNGWTAEVIIHLLGHALKDVPRNRMVIVISMYDGIGTGRYCLDKLGFNSFFENIVYNAYEIDKYAIAIAQSNYPDIGQFGDAFNIREAKK